MRKPRIWDSKLLSDTYALSAQIQAHIESMQPQLTNMGLLEVPHSMVPTPSLYNLAICYNLAYNLLIDHDLIKTGNKKQELRMLQ